MPKYTYFALAAATAGLVALGAASPALAAAPRTPVTLTLGSATGPNVAVGDVLSAALSGTSTLGTSAGNITCKAGSFSSKVLTNTTTAATATVTSLSFTASTCTSGIPGTTGVTSIGLKSGTAPVASISPTTLQLTVTPTVAVVLSSILGPVSCYYAGSAVGNLVNASHSLAFPSVSVTKQTGSSALCPASGTFVATYAPVVDTTQASQDVWVN